MSDARGRRSLPIASYASLIFDCDGVVLDSNRIKTAAFFAAAKPWGEAPARALVAYHTANGGISRFEKFRHFLETILPAHAPGALPGRDGPGLDGMLEAYAGAVREDLLTCAVAEGLQALRAATSHARWLIVSGGAQAELRQVFNARGLAANFDGGIFGSPDSKDVILARELESGNITRPALFLGDSRYDHQAAGTAGLDFVFVSDWTEMIDWQDYVRRHGLDAIPSLSTLALSSGPGARSEG